jgi:hypothetical protein
VLTPARNRGGANNDLAMDEWRHRMVQKLETM